MREGLGQAQPGQDVPCHVVVMGVSGVGKTTVAQMLAERLGYVLAEGDDFHPAENVEKMSAGVALDDDDRMPWLQALAAWLRDRQGDGACTVMTCSALARRYRDVLREGARGVVFVHLVGDQDLLRQRMGGRRHFMPADLLQSQVDALEPLEADERGVSVDVVVPPTEVVDEVLDRLAGV